MLLVTCYCDILYVGIEIINNKCLRIQINTQYICNFPNLSIIYLAEIHYIHGGSMKSHILFILLPFILQIQIAYGQGKLNKQI